MEVRASPALNGMEGVMFVSYANICSAKCACQRTINTSPNGPFIDCTVVANSFLNGPRLARQGCLQQFIHSSHKLHEIVSLSLFIYMSLVKAIRVGKLTMLTRGQIGSSAA